MIAPRGVPRTGSILALTGGGILARFTTEVLQTLQKQREVANGPATCLCDAFDVMAGTSAGALVVGGLAIGRSPSELCDLFDRHGAKIFPGGMLRSVRQLVTAKYSSRALAAAVDDALQGRSPRLGDIDHPIALPALNESTGRPIIFTNLDPAHADVPLRDAILASTAAPTYFPAVRIAGDRYVDGGVFANAPDIAAVSLLRRRWPNLHLRDIHVVSVGTTNAHSTSRANPARLGNWGLIPWMVRPTAHLLTMTLRAQVDFTVDLAPQLELADFIRIDAELMNGRGQAYLIDDASSRTRAALIAAAGPALSALLPEKQTALKRIIRRNRFVSR